MTWFHNLKVMQKLMFGYGVLGVALVLVGYDISNTIASAVEEQSATTNEMSRNVAEAAKGAVDISQTWWG